MTDDIDRTGSASDRQLEFLRRNGFDTSKPWGHLTASYAIGDYVAGRRSLPPTARQRWALQQRGLWRDGMTRGEAFDLIAQITAAARWGNLPG